MTTRLEEFFPDSVIAGAAVADLEPGHRLEVKEDEVMSLGLELLAEYAEAHDLTVRKHSSVNRVCIFEAPVDVAAAKAEAQEKAAIAVAAAEDAEAAKAALTEAKPKTTKKSA